MITLATFSVLRRPGFPEAPYPVIGTLDSITGSTVTLTWTTSSEFAPYDSSSLYMGQDYPSASTFQFSSSATSYAAGALEQGTRYVFILRGKNVIGFSTGSVTASVYTNCSGSLLTYSSSAWWKSTYFDSLNISASQPIGVPWLAFDGNYTMSKSSNGPLPKYQRYNVTPFMVTPWRAYTTFTSSAGSSSYSSGDHIMSISPSLTITGSIPYTVMALIRPATSSVSQSLANTNTLLATSESSIRWYTGRGDQPTVGWGVKSSAGYPSISPTGSDFIDYDIAVQSSSANNFRLITISVPDTSSIKVYENTFLIGSTSSQYHPSASISWFGGVTDEVNSTDHLNADVMELAIFTGSALSKDQIHNVYTDYYNVMYPHLPYQYYTESLLRSLANFTRATEIVPGVKITFSQSYAHNVTGSIVGYVEGMTTSSWPNLEVKLYYVTTSETPANISSSIYTYAMHDSRSYENSWTRSIVGTIDSVLPDYLDDYYVAGYSDNYLNGTSSITVADIVFDNRDYTLPYLGIISGSITNLASGSFSDYKVYVYRYLKDDILYLAKDPPPSASFDETTGQWAVTSSFAGHANFPIFVKMRHKVTGETKAVAGLFEPSGQYFNAGVNGYYITVYGPVGGADAFPNDNQYTEPGVHVSKLKRKSDNKAIAASNNPAGSGAWALTSYNTSSKVYKLYDTASNLLAETWNGVGLIRSYANPPGDPVGYKRTYIYDQGLAIIAFCNVNDYAHAEDCANGAMAAQKLATGQWSFSTNCVSGEYDDNYYRTGAQAWVVEGLAYFLKKYPNTPIYNQVTQSLKRYWTAAFRDYWMESSGSGLIAFTGSSPYTSAGYQLHSFTGGLGSYGPSGVFTASAIVPWCSTEHNVDSWFALRCTAQVIPDWSASLEASSSKLGWQLFNTYWASAQNRGYQGVGTPTGLDGQHALDVTTWYGMFQDSYGNVYPQSRSVANFRFSGSLNLLPDYYTSSAWAGNQIEGFVPYVPKWGYDSPPLNNPSVWIEGSSGAILAMRRAGRHKEALKYYKNMLPSFNTVTGFPYALSASADVYEIGCSGSVASTAWMIMSGQPEGFWECPF